MAHDNVELLRRADEAFNAGDPSVWLGLYDPDIVLVVAPGGGPDPGTYVGAAEVERWFTDLFRAFGRGSYHLDILEAIPVGDSVVVVQRDAARGRASGAEVRASRVNVVTFRGGRIIRYDIPESHEAAMRLVGPSS